MSLAAATTLDQRNCRSRRHIACPCHIMQTGIMPFYLLLPSIDAIWTSFCSSVQDDREQQADRQWSTSSCRFSCVVAALNAQPELCWIRCQVSNRFRWTLQRRTAVVVKPVLIAVRSLSPRTITSSKAMRILSSDDHNSPETSLAERCNEVLNLLSGDQF
jgi:hypothetical protein